MPNRAGPNDFGLQAEPNRAAQIRTKAVSGAPRIATLVQERPADQSCGAPSTFHCAHSWRRQPGASSRSKMPRHDPRDALGDLLVDAVVPVLGWPAFYKCSALNRAWRAALQRVGRDLRRRHAPPPPRFGLALLDLPLFVDRVVPFLSCSTREGRRDVKASWAGLFRLCPVSRAWNAAVTARARRAIRRLHDKTPTSFRPDAADVEMMHSLTMIDSLPVGRLRLEGGRGGRRVGRAGGDDGGRDELGWRLGEEGVD